MADYYSADSKFDRTTVPFQVWRLMRRRRLRPSVYHYNLLLRAVRDCGVADERALQQLLLPPLVATATGAPATGALTTKSTATDARMKAVPKMVGKIACPKLLSSIVAPSPSAVEEQRHRGATEVS